MDSRELKGDWWLPGKPSCKVSGTLSFGGDDTPRLSLIGTLLSFDEYRSLPRNFAPPIILGRSATGEQVTLYRCHEVSTTFSSGHSGISTATFIASLVFVGRHFDTPDQLLFERLAIRYDRIVDWVWISGFHFIREPESGRLRKLTVEYSLPPSILEVNVTGLAIRFIPDFYHRSTNAWHHDLQQRLFIEVQPSHPMSVEDFVEEIFYHVQNFICLGLGYPVYPVEVRATLPVSSRKPKLQESSLQTVEVYYAGTQASIKDKPIYAGQMLFNFISIRNEFEQYLTSWFSKATILKPVYDLYFGTMYGSGMYPESNFLNLAQAVETYHRRVDNDEGTYLKEDQFAPLRAALVKTLDGFGLSSQVRDAYKKKLKYFNEWSLRKRLKRVLKSCGKSVTLLIPNINRFVERVVTTRNYLTHYDPELKARAATGPALHSLTNQLKSVLEICLLKEIGFSEEKREQIINDTLRYKL